MWSSQGPEGINSIVVGASDGVKRSSGSWMTVLGSYRMGVVGDSELVVGELDQGFGPKDPAVVAALADWDGRTYVAEGGGSIAVALTRPVAVLASRPWLVHAGLFLFTLLTMHVAGALLRGVDPVVTRFFEVGRVWLPLPTTIDWDAMALGAPFALTLMTILMAHEMGHFLTARWHGVRASLPYLIPFPAYYSAIGTLGAFIWIRGPIVRRSELLDIGIAGPVASFILSTLFLEIGLSRSRPALGAVDGLTPLLVEFAGQSIALGTGPLVHGLAYLALSL